MSTSENVSRNTFFSGGKFSTKVLALAAERKKSSTEKKSRILGDGNIAKRTTRGKEKSRSVWRRKTSMKLLFLGDGHVQKSSFAF